MPQVYHKLSSMHFAVSVEHITAEPKILSYLFCCQYSLLLSILPRMCIFGFSVCTSKLRLITNLLTALKTDSRSDSTYIYIYIYIFCAVYEKTSFYWKTVTLLSATTRSAKSVCFRVRSANPLPHSESHVKPP